MILQKFLYENSSYSLDEYFEFQKKLNIYIIFGQTYERFGTHLCFPNQPICIIYLFCNISRWRFKSLFVTQSAKFLSVSIFKWFIHMPLFYYILFYFIILNNSFCTETSNTVLDHVTVEHFVLILPLDSYMWLFPYPYGFCNPVQIYGKKINMIWYDMIWYDMIWYDMIWNMIWWMSASKRNSWMCGTNSHLPLI